MLKIAKAKRNNLPFILQSLHPIDIFEHMLCANHWAYKDKYIFLCEELIICWRSQRVKERNCRKLCTLLSCCCSVSKLCPTLQPHGLQPARLLCPWDSPGQNTGMGGCSILQVIFPTQVSCIAGGFLKKIKPWGEWDAKC